MEVDNVGPLQLLESQHRLREDPSVLVDGSRPMAPWRLRMQARVARVAKPHLNTMSILTISNN